jgi:hypothetical protein
MHFQAEVERPAGKYRCEEKLDLGEHFGHISIADTRMKDPDTL